MKTRIYAALAVKGLMSQGSIISRCYQHCDSQQATMHIQLNTHPYGQVHIQMWHGYVPFV